MVIVLHVGNVEWWSTLASNASNAKQHPLPLHVGKKYTSIINHQYHALFSRLFTCRATSCGSGRARIARPVGFENRSDPTRPDPTRPDPTRRDPTGPGLTGLDPRGFDTFLTRPAGPGHA